MSWTEDPPAVTPWGTVDNYVEVDYWAESYATEEGVVTNTFTPQPEVTNTWL